MLRVARVANGSRTAAQSCRARSRPNPRYLGHWLQLDPASVHVDRREAQRHGLTERADFAADARHHGWSREHDVRSATVPVDDDRDERLADVVGEQQHLEQIDRRPLDRGAHVGMERRAPVGEVEGDARARASASITSPAVTKAATSAIASLPVLLVVPV